MAVVARTARQRLTTSLGALREWTATARAQDVAAGGSLLIDITQATSGAAPPATATTLELSVRVENLNTGDTDPAVRTFVLDPALTSQTVTLNLTADGTAAGAPRAGTFRLRLLAANSGATTAYRVNSDDGTTQTIPTGATVERDQGWVRGTTTATLSVSPTQGGPAVPLLAYPDPFWQRAVLGAQLLQGRQFTVAVGPVSGLTISSVGPNLDRQHAGVIDTRFPAALSSHAQTVTVPTSPLTGLPVTVLTTTTAPAQDVDPRLTVTPLFQLDDDVFGTPPLSKNEPTFRRLTSQIGYLAGRYTNARGEGQNGLTVTRTLRPVRPGDSVTSAGVTTGTQGGEPGWSPLLAWQSQLPAARWIKTHDVTAPAAIAGDTYLVGTTVDHFVVAVDPDVTTDLIVGGTIRDRHLHAGDVLIIGMELQNGLDTDLPLVPDSDADGPIVVAIIKRPKADATGSEYLAADLTWRPTVDATGVRAAVTRHRIPVVAGTAGQVYLRIFPAQVLADTSDVAVTGRMVREGAAYQSKVVREVVGANHAHDTVEAAGGDVQPADIAAIANAVWDESTLEQRAASTFGALLLARLDTAIGTRATAESIAALGSPAQAPALDVVRALAQGARDDVALLSQKVTALGTPAQQAALAEALADLDALLLRLSDTRATGLDSLTRLDQPVSQARAAIEQAVQTRASQASVDALGQPVQTTDPRLDQAAAPDQPHYDGSLT